MKDRINVDGKQSSISLKGKIYAHDAGIIRDQLLDEIERGAKVVQIDLSETAYIDSSGLGVLVSIHKRTQAVQGRLILTGVQGMVAELLARTRLNKVLTIV